MSSTSPNDQCLLMLLGPMAIKFFLASFSGQDQYGQKGKGRRVESDIVKEKFFLCKLVGCPSKAPSCQGNYKRAKSWRTFCVAAKFVIDLKPVDQLQPIGNMWTKIYSFNINFSAYTHSHSYSY